jgi:hypothetical protein
MRSRLRRAFGEVACVCAGIMLMMSAAAAAISSASDARTANRSTSIMGAAWKADNTPIPNAKVRLRDIVTGKIQAATAANEAGQFLFGNILSGSYIVELISDSGRILAVGHTVAVDPGETVATFVRLGTKVPWFDGFFGNAATAVASAAASTGITAMAPEEMQCASPPCSQK